MAIHPQIKKKKRKMQEKIEKRGDEFCVVSEDGTREFGCFATEDAAKKRLEQVEFFKRQPESKESTGRLFEAGPVDKQGRTWNSVIIAVGESKNTVEHPDTGIQVPRVYTVESLKKAVEDRVFEGAVAMGVEDIHNAIFDHLPENIDVNRLPKNTVGVFHGVSFDESVGEQGAVVAKFTFVDDDLRKRNLTAFEATGKPLFGFSINGGGIGDFTESSFEIEIITETKSIDAVSRPAAGGKMVRPLAASVRLVASVENRTEGDMRWFKLLASLVKTLGLKSEAATKVTEAVAETLTEAQAVELLRALLDDPEVADHKDMLQQILDDVVAKRKPEEEAPTQEAGHKVVERDGKFFVVDETGETVAGPFDTRAEAEAKLPKADATEGLSRGDVATQVADILKSRDQEADVSEHVTKQIEQRQLPESAAKLVRESVSHRPRDMGHAKKALDRVSEAMSAGGWDGPKITITKEATDKKREYWEKAIEGGIQGKAIDNIKPARSINQILARVSGIFEPDPYFKMGVIGFGIREAVNRVNKIGRGYELDESRTRMTESLMESARGQMRNVLSQRYGLRMRESVDTTTFAQVFAAVLFKRLLKRIQRPQVNDWRALVSDEKTLQDFRTNREVRTGRYPLLAQVSEGGPFQPIVTPGDEEVTFSATKFGNTEDWTMEAALADDLKQIGRIPEDLMDTALETRRKEFWNLFSDNTFTGGQIFDGTNLFTAGHNNLETNPFSLDDLTTNRIAHRQQTPFDGADQELGAANLPKFVVAVTELEDAVRKVVNSQTRPESEQPAGVDNLHQGMQWIILDHLTASSTFWFTASDPAKMNTILFGTVQGFEQPRMFVNDSENVGPRFDEDKITLKVEDAHARAVLDFRPFTRGNV